MWLSNQTKTNELQLFKVNNKGKKSSNTKRFVLLSCQTLAITMKISIFCVDNEMWKFVFHYHIPKFVEILNYVKILWYFITSCWNRQQYYILPLFWVIMINGKNWANGKNTKRKYTKILKKILGKEFNFSNLWNPIDPQFRNDAAAAAKKEYSKEISCYWKLQYYEK